MKNFLKWYDEHSSVIRLIFTIASGVALLISLVFTWTGNAGELVLDPAWIAIILCGLPIIIGAVVGVVKDHDITADVLVSLALIGSMILKEWFAAGEVAFIMQIGSILEDFTSERAQKGISKLIKLTPRKANLLRDNGELTVVDANNVAIGDLFQVLAGEAVPVDGEIIEGSTSIDQSAMTGESVPVEKSAGDTVMSGTVNQNGTITVMATKTAEDSSLQRMVKLAEAADAQKAKIVRQANKWAAWLVVISLSVAIIAGVVLGLVHSDFRLGFTRAVTVLVVFCPCAFVLATPTAISAGIGNASRHGVIIQSGEALERIAAANTAVFDKTGTLTIGKPSVVKIESRSTLSEEEVIKVAASGEVYSNHPLAKAIVDCNRSDLYEISDHQTVAGKGIGFKINGTEYFVGKVEAPDAENASTSVGVYKSGELLGVIYIEDVVKDNAGEMISNLKNLGIKTVLLTGDNQKAAADVANKLKIDEYRANCSPEDKMTYIKEKEAQGNMVAMFGDGVNDSPALRTAYAGIAMGGIGSDVAIESSDAVIVNDNLDAVPYLFRISRKTKERIGVNLVISMVLNFIAVALSVAGILNTVYGALFHNCGSVAVVISAFLLLFSKAEKSPVRSN